jgi:hypothetical protein
MRPLSALQDQIAGLGGAALLLIGALVPDARPFVAIAVVAGWGILAATRNAAAIGWAAALPLAVVLTWPLVLGLDRPVGPLACADPLSVIALRRVVIAVVVIGLVVALARIHGSAPADLGLRRPRRWELGLALGGLVALAMGGLVIGPWLAEPFFGRVEFERPLGAIIPALVFGVMNGTLEELAYRGALQGWLGGITRAWIAIVVQALAFGIVHVGADVTAFVPIHAALLTATGLVAGLWVRRTGSLAVPIGVHIGADIALYVGLACRAAA